MELLKDLEHFGQFTTKIGTTQYQLEDILMFCFRLVKRLFEENMYHDKKMVRLDTVRAKSLG